MAKIFCKKYILIILLAVLFVAAVVFGAIKIVSIVKGNDLNGKTISVMESGTVLNKYHNGKIIIKSSVETGLVILKNCHDISVVVQSNACLLLDNKTSIKKLSVRSNALVDSLEAFQLKQNGKQLLEQNSKLQISELEIKKGCSPIIKNVEYQTITEVDFGNEVSDDNKKLNITQDTSFEGLGVRLLIENIPSAARSVYVVIVENGVERQIDWFAAKDDSARFYSGVYDYRFLDSGKEYTFRFYYQDSKNNIVGKCQVSAVAARGKELKIDTSTAKITIDEKTGDISWESLPLAEMPEGTQLVYDMVSYGRGQSWNYVGQVVKNPADFDSINIYKDMKIYNPENLYNNKVFISIFYCYETYRWTIMETEQFNVHF